MQEDDPGKTEKELRSAKIGAKGIWGKPRNLPELSEPQLRQ
jgi:hypothetical protein